MSCPGLAETMRADGVSESDVTWIASRYPTLFDAASRPAALLDALNCSSSQLAAVCLSSVPLAVALDLMRSRQATASEVVALCRARVPLLDARDLIEAGVPVPFVLTVAESTSSSVDFPLLERWHALGFTADEVVACGTFNVPLDLDDLADLAVAMPLLTSRVRVAAVVLLHGGMDVDQAVLVARQSDCRAWRQTLLTFVADGMPSRGALAAAQALDRPRRTVASRGTASHGVSP